MDLNTHTHIFMDRGSRYSCSTALGPSHQWPQIIRPFRWPENKYMISGSLHGQRQFKHSSQSPSTARSQLCCNSFRDSGKDQDCKICSKTNERVLAICGFETLVWGVKTARIQRDCCGMRWNSTMTAVYPFLRPDKRLKEHSTMNRWVGDYNETWPTFHSRLPRKKSMTSNDSFVSYYCTSRINGGFSVQWEVI